ncbi:hypothetical protein C8P63_10781 [Melghirimyces profundicolus]|uniref:Uncharacterized protein n=1 Tax=Melghirimyces profundicolus TaxID=1242148 RepID=A0A2T6BZ17_9BACL|nr:hypothetical protein C8P63_10781 [Melghirimyces profundicolus]
MKPLVDPNTIHAEKPSPEEYPVKVLDEPMNDLFRHRNMVHGSSKKPDPDNPYVQRGLKFGLIYLMVVLGNASGNPPHFNGADESERTTGIPFGHRTRGVLTPSQVRQSDQTIC